MIKPDKNYRMSKAAKTKVALMCNTAQERNHLKKLLIDGELTAEAARKASLRGKGSKNKDSQE